MTTSTQNRAAVVNWMKARIGKFTYGNSKPGKLTPDVTGFSDCSGTIYADYKSIGITLGIMSYDQANNGTEVGSGTTLAQFKALLPKMKAGDLIAMDLKYSAYTGRVNHVEMYSGVGSMSYGHGGPGRGPNYHDLLIWWLIPSAVSWTVRRVIQDDEAEEVQTIIDERDEYEMLYVIFQNGNSIGVWIPSQVGYSFFPNEDVMRAFITTYKTAGTVKYWGAIRPNRAKKNDHKIDNLSALGRNLKIWG